MKLGQQKGRGGLPGAAYSTGLGWGSDVCCPRPHQPDLEGSRQPTMAIAGRGRGTCKGPVVGDAGLAEPGTLGRDRVKQAGGGQGRPDSSAQGYLTCTSPCPLPPAPGWGSAHLAKIRGGAESVLPSCWPHPQHRPASILPGVPGGGTCPSRRRGAQGLWSEATYALTVVLAVASPG